MPYSVTLRRFNNLLTVIVIILALYITLLPFIPAFSWWVQHQAPLVSKPPTVAAVEALPAENTLVIPALGMSEVIHEGTSIRTLHFGVWHLPKSSSPDKGSNTVLAGHRYTYSGSGVFYHLDKVKTGDSITLYWNHQKYIYNVSKILVVPPTAIEVEAPTNKPRLTIYTCTPMWTFKDRLVIQADLREQS